MRRDNERDFTWESKPREVAEQRYEHDERVVVDYRRRVVHHEVHCCDGGTV